MMYAVIKNNKYYTGSGWSDNEESAIQFYSIVAAKRVADRVGGRVTPYPDITNY